VTRAHGKHWGMVIDTRALQSAEDLEPIIEACHKVHNVPTIENKNHEIKWIWERNTTTPFPAREPVSERSAWSTALPGALQPLRKSALLPACPTQATFKRDPTASC
jgi:hypothetical protein